MAKQLASLPRLREDAALLQWSRQLVDQLESLFIGSLGTEMGGGGGPSTPTGPAGGDLTGSYPDPIIANGAVSDSQITDVSWGKVTGAPAPIPGPPGATGPQGPKGDTGTAGPTGPGVAAGGTTGQILTKTSATDYATTWASAPPPSGSAGGDLTGTYPNPTVSKASSGIIVTGTVPATPVQIIKLAPSQTAEALRVTNSIDGVLFQISQTGAVIGNTMNMSGAVTFGSSLSVGTTANILGLFTPSANGNSLAWGSRLCKGRLTVAAGADDFRITANVNQAGIQDDASKPSWTLALRVDTDSCAISRRAPAGAAADLLTVSNAGNLTATGDLAVGSQLTLGSGTIKGNVSTGVNGDTYLLTNNAFVPYLSTSASWFILMTPGADMIQFFRRAPNAAAGAFTSLFTVDGLGDVTTGRHLFASGNTLQCGSGTVKAQVDGTNGNATLNANNGWGPQDPTKASLQYQLDIGTQTFMWHRRAPSAGAGAFTQLATLDASGNWLIAGSIGQKASGTTWANPSDRRLKDSIEDYSTGLSAILQLLPRTFVYNGKGGSTAGMRGYGFIADEVEPVMPETISVRTGKLNPDDEADTDIQTLDQSNLILALVNAVKELSSRVSTLEAA